MKNLILCLAITTCIGCSLSDPPTSPPKEKESDSDPVGLPGGYTGDNNVSDCAGPNGFEYVQINGNLIKIKIPSICDLNPEIDKGDPPDMEKNYEPSNNSPNILKDNDNDRLLETSGKSSIANPT